MITIIKKHSILLLFLTITTALTAQNLKVFDAKTLSPIENLALYNSDHNISSITNQNGIADISDFAMSDSIIFQHPTYKRIIRTKKELKTLNYSIGLDKKVIKIKEFVVSAYRWEQDKEEVPNKIVTITEEEIEFKEPQTAADLLGTSNQVYIQKSQLGGGSPMIRGFATNSVLLVVDGVRMNNAIFRGGNLQNVISLDAHAIESSEVIFGPGSVTYGSDALGGVMDFHTRSVNLSTQAKPLIKGNAMTRYSTANNEKSGHVEFNYGRANWGALTSISYSDYGHLEMGSRKNPDYRRMEYVDRIAGKDSVVQNPNPDEQLFTAYNQLNVMQKVRFRPNDKMNFNYAFHYSETSDIPRYDRLIQRKDNHLKNAQWYYGPQKWMMHALHANINMECKLFSQAKLTMAYQNYEESRHDREYQEEWLRHRTEKVDAISFNLDFDKDIMGNLLYYGLEYVYNSVQSDAFEENIISGAEMPVQTRYPDGDNDYNTMAAYISYKMNMGEKMNLISGLRYSYFNIHSTIDTTTNYFNFPFHNLSLETGALNGSVGLVYRPKETWRFNLNASSGFHAPNIDDMAKVFDSEPGSVIMPNEDLGAEYAYNLDAGINKSFGERGRINIRGFYTWLENAMVRKEATFNGKDSVIYDGAPARVHKVVNAENAYIYGFSFSVYVKLFENMHFSSHYNYVEGEDSQGSPVRHAAPPFGQTEINYKTDRFRLALYAKYNGKITNEELAESEQSKVHMYKLNDEGEPYSPAWWTLNFKGKYHISEHLILSGGIENILDVRYRPYSSGIVAPGRNFIVSLRARF